MSRDLTKAEYGYLQDGIVQMTQATGKRPTIMAVGPLAQAEFGVSLSLFCMEHDLRLRVSRRLPPYAMLLGRPRPAQSGEAWRGGQP